jgi:aryl-alcohol dehydrogenase-like predicted oxidoreductase
VVGEIAAAHDATPGQVALAWLLGAGADVVPIPGTKRVRYLEENLGALDVVLTEEERGQLDALRPEGERYPDMGWVERDTPEVARG